MLCSYLNFQRTISFDFFKVFQNRRIVESGSLKQIKTKEFSILSFSKVLKNLQFSWKNWKTWQFLPSYLKVGVGDDFVSQKRKKREKKKKKQLICHLNVTHVGVLFR